MATTFTIADCPANCEAHRERLFQGTDVDEFRCIACNQRVYNLKGELITYIVSPKDESPDSMVMVKRNIQDRDRVWLRWIERTPLIKEAVKSNKEEPLPLTPEYAEMLMFDSQA